MKLRQLFQRNQKVAVTPIIRGIISPESWAARIVAEAQAASPEQKWADFKAAAPLTYHALEGVCDVCPNLIASVSEYHDKTHTKVRVFKLAAPGFENVREFDIQVASGNDLINPLRVEYSIGQKRIIRSGRSIRDLSDKAAAEAVENAAKTDGYIDVVTVKGFDGFPRDKKIMAGSASTGIIYPEAWSDRENTVLPDQKWADLKASSPITYHALEAVCDACPTLIVSASEVYRDEAHQMVREFELALSGFETAEEIRTKHATGLRIFHPLWVEYSASQERIIRSGWSAGDLSDGTAAEAVLNAAKGEGYIDVETVKGWDGLPRAKIVAGPAASIRMPRHGLRLVSPRP
jgi:hypothetical protein